MGLMSNRPFQILRIHYQFEVKHPITVDPKSSINADIKKFLGKKACVGSTNFLKTGDRRRELKTACDEFFTFAGPTNTWQSMIDTILILKKKSEKKKFRNPKLGSPDNHALRNMIIYFIIYTALWADSLRFSN